MPTQTWRDFRWGTWAEYYWGLYQSVASHLPEEACTCNAGRARYHWTLERGNRWLPQCRKELCDKRSYGSEESRRGSYARKDEAFPDTRFRKRNKTLRLSRSCFPLVRKLKSWDDVLRSVAYRSNAWPYFSNQSHHVSHPQRSVRGLIQNRLASYGFA